MRFFHLFALVLLSGFARADTAPTRESVERLLVLTDVKVLVDRMHVEVTGVAEGLMKVALKGRTLTSDEQRQADDMLKKIIADAMLIITWERMCDSYVPLYQKAFSQEEINGMIAFYESPAGRAFMARMPGVAQEAAATMTQRLIPVMTLIKAETEKGAAKLSAERK